MLFVMRYTKMTTANMPTNGNDADDDDAVDDKDDDVSCCIFFLIGF